MYSFHGVQVFTKGINYAEFFDIASGNLLGFSRVVKEFGLNGSVNPGDIEGGPGNQLIMCIPDTGRLEITARTTDSDLNNMALPIGGNLAGNGIIEVSQPILASGNKLNVTNAVAPYGGSKAIAYVLTSSGDDKATVEAGSGRAYPVSEAGELQGFTAKTGASYCVKYFVRNSSAKELGIPALFQPKVVRAHFAVNMYTNGGNGDAMSSSLYGIRHYYIPRYFFTAGLQDGVGQTEPGSVDLSGKALSFEQYQAEDVCASQSGMGYGFIVDEIVGENSSTAAVDGIYFIGLGEGVNIEGTGTVTLPTMYEVGGALADISDMTQVTYSTPDQTHAKFTDPHSNVITGVTAGSTTATVSVTNSRTGVEYHDAIPVTVT